MAEDKYNKKEIKKEARQLLKQGTPKQEAFELLKEKYKYSKIIADLLKELPSKQAIEKYGIWNTVLLILLSLTIVIFFLATPSIGILLWYGLLIYAVARRLVKYYLWITVLSAFVVIVFLVSIFAYDSVTINWIILMVLSALIIPSIILPIWLEKKLCPKPKETKVKYTNSKGQNRLKIVYEFPNESSDLASEDYLD